MKVEFLVLYNRHQNCLDKSLSSDGADSLLLLDNWSCCLFN